MNPYDVKFKASDARGIVKSNRDRKDQVYHKIHSMVVLKIKRAAERNRLYTTFKVPLCVVEYSGYSPQTALEWLISRLEDDGYMLQVDFRHRTMIISWAKYDTDDGIGSEKSSGKSVRFKLPKESIYTFK